jgi:hypothetical protein
VILPIQENKREQQNKHMANTTWSISGDFDDCVNVDLLDEDGFPFGELSPTDGEGVDEWGEASRARAKAIVNVPFLLASLKEIREKAQDAQHDKAPGILLECFAIAEEALSVAEGK